MPSGFSYAFLTGEAGPQMREKSAATRRARSKEILIFILVNLGQGKDNAFIAKKLNVGTMAVHNRISRAVPDYGCTSRLELFASFVRSGDITPEMLRSLPEPKQEWFYRQARS